jgi:glycosyltransferase involved in cell wall biosynthesis
VDPAQSSVASSAAAVCIPLNGAEDELERCLITVAKHTPPDVPIVLCGDAGGAPTTLPGDQHRALLTVSGGLDLALQSASPADVAVLSPGCLVAEGWLDDLRAVAYGDSRVATVSGLPSASVELPAGERFERAAARVRQLSPRIHPRLSMVGSPCVYIRRSALELIGGFDGFDQFSSRCLRNGLVHLLADEVLAGSAQPLAEPPAPAANGQLTRALAAARGALEGVSLLIDARILSGPMNGTKLHVLELLAAVARTKATRTRVLVAEGLESHVRGQLEALEGVEPVTVPDALGSGLRVDVVHRPYQLGTPADLNVLGALGERLVVTQQDLIEYDNPFYFSSRHRWESYRALTRRALAAADRVIFSTAHTCDAALAEGLVEPGRVSVVPLGVDHTVVRTGQPPATMPPAADRLGAETEVMLCIGTDFWHKNRMFALRILDQLRRRHGWLGYLIFAGSRMSSGSSAAAEAELLAEDPGLRGAVLDVGAVSEAEKEWLLSRASLVLYPTVHEGFGLVPFEAADWDVPCMWARGTSLSELLPDSAAGIQPWDASSSADHALTLMRDSAAKDENVRAVREAGTRLRWDETARQLVEVYAATRDQAPSLAGARERDHGIMRRGLSEDALRLIGPDGALPPELERPLLAIATRPRLSRPVFGVLKAGYRVSKRRPRRRGSNGDS